MTRSYRIETFGKMPDGREVHMATLTNGNGLTTRILTLGATLQSVETPDRAGYFANICLGHDSLDAYLSDTTYMGAVIGRYANRIAAAAMRIDGDTYQLSHNEGAHCLHGGEVGFNKALWQITTEGPGASVTLSHISPDSDQGFPGELSVQIRYELNDYDELILDMSASTTKPTVVSLAPHPYWNLSGQTNGAMSDHILQIEADHFLVVTAAKLPTGEIEAVKGTALDFRQSRQLDTTFELDHCFVLKDQVNEAMQQVMTLRHEPSGRFMRLQTNAPALQVYDGHKLPSPFIGIAIEPQQYPDAPNRPAFPSPLLRPGEIGRSTSVYGFGLSA